MAKRRKSTVESLRRAEQLVAEAAGTLFKWWGFRPVTGKVWAALFLSDQERGADELREVLGISTGALSTALRRLVDLGLVERHPDADGRRLLYRAETDLWFVVTSVFRDRERERLREVVDNLREAEQLFEAAAGSDEDGSVAFRLEQVRRLVSLGVFVLDLLDAFMERTRTELKAAQKWLKMSGRLGGEPLSRLRRAIQDGKRDLRRR